MYLDMFIAYLHRNGTNQSVQIFHELVGESISTR